MIIIITILVLAIILGAYLATFMLQNKNTPKGVVFIHGPLAALGLVFLIFYIFLESALTWATIVSVIFLILAALLGFVMILRDLTGKTIPKPLLLSHGSCALLGFLFLILHSI